MSEEPKTEQKIVILTEDPSPHQRSWPGLPEWWTISYAPKDWHSGITFWQSDITSKHCPEIATLKKDDELVITTLNAIVIRVEKKQ